MQDILPRVVDPISRISIHRRFPACLPRDREFGLSPFNARLMNDNAPRALLSMGTYFFANAARYMTENEHLRIVRLGPRDRASTVGGLAGLCRAARLFVGHHDG